MHSISNPILSFYCSGSPDSGIPKKYRLGSGMIDLMSTEEQTLTDASVEFKDGKTVMKFTKPLVEPNQIPIVVETSTGMKTLEDLVLPVVDTADGITYNVKEEKTKSPTGMKTKSPTSPIMLKEDKDLTIEGGEEKTKSPTTMKTKAPTVV